MRCDGPALFQPPPWVIFVKRAAELCDQLVIGVILETSPRHVAPQAGLASWIPLRSTTEVLQEDLVDWRMREMRKTAGPIRHVDDHGFQVHSYQLGCTSVAGSLYTPTLQETHDARAPILCSSSSCRRLAQSGLGFRKNSGIPAWSKESTRLEVDVQPRCAARGCRCSEPVAMLEMVV